MNVNWKEQLAKIRKDLPIAERHRRLTRKEVVTREVETIVRVSDRVKRKRKIKLEEER